MSDLQTGSTPPETPQSQRGSEDVVQQMIELCQRELETIAQALDYATMHRDIEHATAAILEIQAGALLHGLDEIAVLATEAEHAIDMNPQEPAHWQQVAQRLVSQCRQRQQAPERAA